MENGCRDDGVATRVQFVARDRRRLVRAGAIERKHRDTALRCRISVMLSLLISTAPLMILRHICERNVLRRISGRYWVWHLLRRPFEMQMLLVQQWNHCMEL